MGLVLESLVETGLVSLKFGVLGGWVWGAGLIGGEDGALRRLG